jgi:hypothetical protein
MAADCVKYGAPGASSMALLAWNLVECGQGSEQVGVRGCVFLPDLRLEGVYLLCLAGATNSGCSRCHTQSR